MADEHEENDDFAAARSAFNGCLQHIIRPYDEEISTLVSECSYDAVNELEKAVGKRFERMLVSVNAEVRRIMTEFMARQTNPGDIEARALDAEQEVRAFTDEELFDRFISRAVAGAYTAEQLRRIIRLVV